MKMRHLAALAVLVSFPALAAEGNLLAGKVPSQTEGISEPQRMTDGVASPEGDEWKSTRTSVISINGFAIWDLGEVVEDRRLWIEANALLVNNLDT